ncbi:MAG: hypothetical protein ACOCUD_02870 [Bacillota bacterium]
MKIIKKHQRQGLGEGRDYGMGFGFLKKITNTKFETTSPISACKDYLNDALYAEKTGKILPSIYSFKYQQVSNIIGKYYTHLGIEICKSLHGPSHYDQNSFEQEKENFKKNYKNLENFMNQLEEKLGISYKTKIIKADDDLYVVKMPNFWTKRIYLLSLYTLLLRAFQEYTPEITAEEALEKGKIYSGDSFMINGVKDKIKKILAGELPEQPFKKTASVDEIHNKSGIVSFKFKV